MAYIVMAYGLYSFGLHGGLQVDAAMTTWALTIEAMIMQAITM